MMITNKQAESHSAVPYSISSHPASGDTAALVTNSITITPRTDKPINLTTGVSSLTQPNIKEKSQVTDDDQQPNADANITKDTISE